MWEAIEEAYPLRLKSQTVDSAEEKQKQQTIYDILFKTELKSHHTVYSVISELHDDVEDDDIDNRKARSFSIKIVYERM